MKTEYEKEWTKMEIKYEKSLNDWMHIYSNYLFCMINTLVKLKLLKLTLLGAFGAGVLAALIAKEMRKKQKTEDIDD